MSKDRGERRVLFMGAFLGAVLGCVLALLWHRRTLRHPAGVRQPTQVRKLIRLGSSLVPVVRQVLDLVS